MTGLLEYWKLMGRSDKHWMQGVNLREKQGIMHLTSDEVEVWITKLTLELHHVMSKGVGCHITECWYIVIFTAHTLSIRCQTCTLQQAGAKARNAP